MDQLLRGLKRKAESAGEWETYARALERAYGLAEPKLFAVLTGDDTFGDSIWNGGYPIPYQDGDDEFTLVTRYAKSFFRESCDECLAFVREHGMGYYCGCLECEDCKTVDKYVNGDHLKNCNGDPELYAGMVPTVAWIIDEATALGLQTAAKVETCTDSAYYQLNSGLKQIAKDNAIKTIEFGKHQYPERRKCATDNCNELCVGTTRSGIALCDKHKPESWDDLKNECSDQ